jgi:hypothetical protein
MTWTVLRAPAVTASGGSTPASGSCSPATTLISPGPTSSDPFGPASRSWSRALPPASHPGSGSPPARDPYSAVARFARLQGLRYHRFRGPELLHHPAALYGAAMRRWLSRFQGVATRYLPHYLAWHRLLVACQTDGLVTCAAHDRLLQAYGLA